MSDIPRILSLVSGAVWAIDPTHGQRLMAVLSRRAFGDRLDADQIEKAVGRDKALRAERLAAADRLTARSGGVVAVLPLYGSILAREWQAADASGGGVVSAEGFSKRFRSLEQDPNVRSIVLDVDSPGGDVTGVQEAADVIHGSSKPVVAVANGTMASAAYWLGSQANEVISSPSSGVGSIGVYTMHQDVSGMLESEGISTTLVSAGKHKVEAHPFGPLEDDARAQMQSVVDTAYGNFVGAVARGRGVSASAVRGGFGEGRLLDAKAAKKAGMIDSIATLDATVERLAMGGRVKPRRKAVAETFEEKIRAALGTGNPDDAECYSGMPDSPGVNATADLVVNVPVAVRFTIDPDEPTIDATGGDPDRVHCLRDPDEPKQEPNLSRVARLRHLRDRAIL